jgi:phage/plasmid-like protein (TIGR03299 family)
MSHQIESMAYNNQVPWHGLGKKVDGKQTVSQMLKAAGLDWNVERQPLILGNWHDINGRQVPIEVGRGPGEESKAIDGFAALVRDKDNTVFDIVGSQYTPVQNAQAFEFFNEFVKAGKATMETAGSLRGGRYVWGLANLNASFKLRGDDVVKGYLLCACPHQQGKSMIFKFTTVRVVCNNTLTLSLGSSSAKKGNGEFTPVYRRSHRSEFDEAAVEQAKTALGIARDQLGEFEKTARKLQAIKITEDLMIRTLMPIFSEEEKIKEVLADQTKAPAKVKAIIDCTNRAPGAQPNNAWGLLNGFTYYADHIASRSADKRLTNAWLGTTARQKEELLAVLLEL